MDNETLCAPDLALASVEPKRTLLLGDSLEQLKLLEPDSVDSVVTDPPYGLAFMGKKWDYDVPSVALWREVLRVLKPGGHLLSFGGTRTYHRMVVAIEDAGFEIRDQIAWLYGVGFPKSLNVNKQSATLACGCKSSPEHDLRSVRASHLSTPINAKDQSREILQSSVPEHGSSGAVLRAKSKEGSADGAQSGLEGRGDVQADEGQLHRAEVCPVSAGVQGDGAQGRLRDGASASDSDAHRADLEPNGSGASLGPQHAEQSHQQPGALADERKPQGGGAWALCFGCGKPVLPEGLGTALKPANEPIVLARKPLGEKTVAKNVLKFGTGALNVDASRIATEDNLNGGTYSGEKRPSSRSSFGNGEGGGVLKNGIGRYYVQPTGRWPANVLFDEEAAALLDKQSGVSKSPNGPVTQGKRRAGSGYDRPCNDTHEGKGVGFGDSGGASRFFYVAKASKRERNAGLEGMPEIVRSDADGLKMSDPRMDKPQKRIGNQNHHPTVKPIKLMEYLIRMITPPGGTCLDPFMGSGTTGCAAVGLGFDFIGIEREAEYLAIAEKRIAHWRG